MDNKQDVQKDYTRFTKAGRNDWKLMLESRNKKAQETKKAAALGHNLDARQKVVAPEVGKGKKDRPRVKDGKIEEDGTADAGPGTTTGGIAPIATKLGQKPKDITQKPVTEESDEVVSVDVVPGEEAEKTPSSPKIDSIEKKRAKLEEQMAELEEEKLRVIKLSELATQKAALQEQLAAIKEEMAEVKSGKGEAAPKEDAIPSAEENAEHEATETPAEEKEEHESGEEKEDGEEETTEKTDDK